MIRIVKKIELQRFKFSDLAMNFNYIKKESEAKEFFCYFYSCRERDESIMYLALTSEHFTGFLKDF